MEKGFGNAFGYKRFSGTPRVLMIEAPYFGVREICEAITDLGWELLKVRLKELKSGTEDFLKGLLFSIATFKPDFVFTINHFGFDEKGILASIFSQYSIPCVSWFLDSPLFILEAAKLQRFDTLVIFSWDSYYVNVLKDLGFSNVFYLPLGTHPKYFHPNKEGHKGFEITFVGNSMDHGIRKSLKQLRLKMIPKEIAIKAEQMGKGITHACDNLKAEMFQKELIHKIDNTEDVRRTVREFALFTWVANQIYRKAIVNSLYGFWLTIVGDEGWKGLVNGNLKVHPEVNYYSELGGIYKRSEINLNLTSFQMPYGVNQRVFDVPATASFLITDFQKDLFEIFEPEKDVVVFHEEEDLVEKVEFYKKRPLLREKIAQSAYQKVIKGHTYHIRLVKLYKQVKEVFS